MKTIKLNNGVVAPLFGFGTYRINPVSLKNTSQMQSAGYRLFDTAQYYQNEAQVGRAINNSGIPRSEFFLTTKARTGGYEATKRVLKNP